MSSWAGIQLQCAQLTYLGPAHLGKPFHRTCAQAGLMSYPVPRKWKRSLHTCVQDVQITRFTKALEICTRRFRRNLDTRIFPKFF
jgi:hypothetical protein